MNTKPRKPLSSRIKAKASKRSVCPIACTLDIVGDKWTLLLVRDLFAGKSHYRDFAASPERIATNILADRLERLAAAGIIAQNESKQRVGSTAYSLTPLGTSLFPLLVAMRDWGLSHIAGTQARMAVPAPE